ncbi:MAG TPA: AAA family ATPase, partial [Candidatus Sulfotelmatobacter sp.]|nr:AAA family ATPase [Candidatus Sulfotelmatobacter sp.]
FYQLKEEPFRLTPDPRFLHLADPHRTALKVLLQGVLQRKGFTVVAGPVGTGKTTLLHTALQILTEKSEGRGRLVSAFLVNPTLAPSELLEAVLEEYEITCTATSKPRRLAALHQMLFQTQQQGGTAILLIDEAHLMSVELLEEIRLLGNTDTYQEKLLQIVLCGQPELFAVLQRPELQALQQRIASTCLLRPLSLPEVRAYMAERLHAAGLRGSSPFTGTAVEVIHRLTGGVPRLINLLSDACLLVGFELKRKQIDQFLVEQASEDVLGLLKGPFAPGGLGTVPANSNSNGREDSAPEQPESRSKWSDRPLQARAAAAAESPSLSSKATATIAAEERRGAKPTPHDANWTKSTFDNLIDALKHGRATARE